MAAKRAVEENIGLVHLCARRFSGKGIEYDDLFQAGCVGLVKAAENFDTERGVKFSTYAVPVMLGQRAQQEADQLREENGERPGVSQIAERLGVRVEKAALALGVSRAPLSLTGSEDGEPIDIPVDAPEEQMTERMTLYEIIETLEERDKRLITLRYFQGKTQTETAEQLDMTQVQVSRREKKLLLMMRAMFNQ